MAREFGVQVVFTKALKPHALNLLSGRIPIAGKISTMVFDKTGTITKAGVRIMLCHARRAFLCPVCEYIGHVLSILYPCFCLTDYVCLSVCLPVCLVCLSIRLSLCLYLSLSAYIYIYIDIY